MNKEFSIRLITPADAEEVLNIYKPYVENTAITFEYEVPTMEEFRARINAITPHYPWLVCESDKKIVGYAYAHKHRDRTAYQWSAESTIYLSENYHGLGIARTLYETLFEMLKLQGFVNVYAGVLSSNEGSRGFHKALGFEEIGMFKNIGFKFGEWHGTHWYQLHLTSQPKNPPIPKMMHEVIGIKSFSDILHSGNARFQYAVTCKSPLTVNNLLMEKQHNYTTTIKWTGNKGTGTSRYDEYERSHTLSIANKPDILCSSDSPFRGDSTKHNPEDMLLTSLSSCHMLWYLHLCADAGVIVTDYVDNATGTMVEKPGGGGHFAEVVLRPIVTVADASMIEKANQLHEKAHEKCFIANSCNFPVKHQPEAMAK